MQGGAPDTVRIHVRKDRWMQLKRHLQDVDATPPQMQALVAYFRKEQPSKQKSMDWRCIEQCRCA
jgi:hypothetical protein